jgi:hypothetical protein
MPLAANKSDSEVTMGCPTNITCANKTLQFLMSQVSSPSCQRVIPIIVRWLDAESGKITASGIPNHLNYCAIFIEYTVYKCGYGRRPAVYLVIIQR